MAPRQVILVQLALLLLSVAAARARTHAIPDTSRRALRQVLLGGGLNGGGGSFSSAQASAQATSIASSLGASSGCFSNAAATSSAGGGGGGGGLKTTRTQSLSLLSLLQTRASSYSPAAVSSPLVLISLF